MQYPDNLMSALFRLGKLVLFLWPYANAVYPAGTLIFPTDPLQSLQRLGSMAGTLLSTIATYKLQFFAFQICR